MATLNEGLVVRVAADTADLRRGMQQAKREVSDVAKVSKDAQGKVTAAFGQMQGAAKKVASSFAAMKGGILAVVGAAALVASPILKAQDAMLEFHGVADVVGQDFGMLQGRVKALAGDLGITYAKAFDDVKLATSALAGDVDRAIASVAASAEAASLELFSEDEARQALIPIVNAFALAGDEIDAAMRTLTATDALSTSGIQEVSGALVSIARDALGAGVGLQELAQAFLFLDQRGANAAEAAQLIEAAIQGALNPTEEQAAAAAKLSLNYQNLGSVGGRLGEILQVLANNTEANAAAVEGFLGSSDLAQAFEGAGRTAEPFAASVARLAQSWSELEGIVERTDSALDKMGKKGADVANGLAEAAEKAQSAWQKLLDAVAEGSKGLPSNEYGPNAGFGIMKNAGGPIPGSGNTDTVPAMLTPGEFVIRKEVAEKLGPFLARLNAYGIDPSFLHNTNLAAASIRGTPLLELLGVGPQRGKGFATSAMLQANAGANGNQILSSIAGQIMQALGTLKFNQGGQVPAVNNTYGGHTFNISANSFDEAFVKNRLAPMLARLQETGQNRRGYSGG